MVLWRSRESNPRLLVYKAKTFCGFSTGRNQYWAGRVYDLCVYYMTGTPEGSTEGGLWRSRELNLRPLVYKAKNFFCGFPGYKPVPSGWFKIVCWFYVGNTQRLTESGFMEKLGIEPATPGLQGKKKLFVAFPG